MPSDELVSMVLRCEDDDFARAQSAWVSPSEECDLGVLLNRTRGAELRGWDLRLLESCLSDLEEARRLGKSLYQERALYVFGGSIGTGRRSLVPSMRSYDFCMGVDFIVKISLLWETQVRTQLPAFTKRLGTLISEEDTAAAPSFETKLRAELMSYSMGTIQAYRHYVVSCWELSLNPRANIYDNTARELGYSGAAEANYRNVEL